MSNIFPAKSALIALSGGVDSAVLLAKAKEAGVVLHAATVISKFTPNAEIKAAEELAARFDVPWHPICLGLLVFE
ncbi:MAG: 7-cyano-7-deazaguanine synthase, partial [Methanocorpusculum sp.]|nr:7-cyano-7-deazaguanine synthase [Methanocorpusculum sp.]